ncbi:cytidine deaminase-like isoform X2 [Schistocerca serialis cubense]|uniref:cytidine deaminase-like isoform X2 n=1 Tax=Schistocerca serialis cubense TaxID=2023355 RepID=UPI00214EE7DA|nr:cytidine deaminase-like isoform X2 [Schistocerca serialis cubense]
MSTRNQEIVKFSDLDSDIQELIRTAVAYRQKAHCPYSNFQVGAALKCDDDSVFGGCNVENVAYGCTICAERTAIVKAVSEGKKLFKHFAITGDVTQGFISPCGSCRQVMVEFGTDMKVYLAKPDFSDVLVTNMDAILPLAFIPLSMPK